MQTSPDRIAFYKRAKPRGVEEIQGYEQKLRDFVNEMAQATGKTLEETIEYLSAVGIVHPLEAVYLKAHLDAWGTL